MANDDAYSSRTQRNGAAFRDHLNGDQSVDDPQRVAYLRNHIQAVAQSIERGAPLRGYFVWSLIDNFEWAEGYSKRFGVVYVDYETQQRIVKDSGKWLAETIARNGFTADERRAQAAAAAPHP